MTDHPSQDEARPDPNDDGGLAFAEKSLSLVSSVKFEGKTLRQAAAQQGLDPGVAFDMINDMVDTLFGVLEDNEDLLEP